MSGAAQYEDGKRRLTEHMCPRRGELGQAGGFEGPDSWNTDGGQGSTCTYCGSLHPDRAMEMIESGEQVTPTDKNYKAYVGQAKVYFQHFSVEQRRRIVTLVNEKKINFAAPGYFYVPPFFAR